MNNIQYFNEGGFPATKMWSPPSFLIKENKEGFVALVVKAPINGDLDKFILNISEYNNGFKYNIIKNKSIDIYIWDGEITLLIADIPIDYEDRINSNLFGISIEDRNGEPKIYFEL